MTGKLPHARAFPMTAIDRQAPFRHWTASQRGPHGQVAEWLKAADCKSARVSRTLVRIQPCPPPSNPRASAEIPRNRRKPSVLSPNPSPCVRSEENTSELPQLMRIPYADFCL